MNEIKQQYNKHLQRFNKACAYLDAPERTDAEVKKWEPEFLKLCRELSKCITMMDKQGIKYTDDEIKRGFTE
jgi:uncharacterized protein YifE (UPF0438 family)